MSSGNDSMNLNKLFLKVLTVNILLILCSRNLKIDGRSNKDSRLNILRSETKKNQWIFQILQKKI